MTNPSDHRFIRRRIIYLFCFILIIPVGLSTRKYGYAMPVLVAKYGGDVLYATCWFFFVRIWLAKPPVHYIALCAFIVCAIIEVSELIQAPWMKKLQHTPPLGLILGYGFNWSDMVCYAVGALIGLGMGKMIERNPLPLKG